MSDLNDLISSVFAGGNLEAISRSLGVSNEETAAGVAAVLPALVGALAGNASTPRGEQTLVSALERDHDGSLLDSLGGMLAGSLGGKATNGGGIMSHLFGDQDSQNSLVNSLAGRSGANPTLVSKLMPILAPLVMAWLGKQLRAKMSGGAPTAAAAGSGGGLADVLGGALGGGGGLGGMLGSVLGQMMGGSQAGNSGSASGGSAGGGLADLLGSVLGGAQQGQPQRPAQQQGPDLGSILGSIFGR